jgi:hypothetical protein
LSERSLAETVSVRSRRVEVGKAKFMGRIEQSLAVAVERDVMQMG